MTRSLFILLFCTFVVMVGFGIVLPVLPFYVERLALEEGATQQTTLLHVALLTGVYSLMQLLLAPFWGRLSDRVGRKPVILIGIGGYVVAQLLFGLANTLGLLYMARIIGGLLSSAILPVASAYVSDLTTEKERTRGMAWLGASVSLGVVFGPALGGVLSSKNWHLSWRFWHLMVDSFSAPFFASALLGILVMAFVYRWLPEPHSIGPPIMANKTNSQVDWRGLVRRLSPVLGLTLAVQFVLAVFEGTIALFTQARFNYGPADVGTIFVVCGLVMAAFQGIVVGYLTGKVDEAIQIALGFVTMGLGLGLMVTATTKLSVLLFVGMIALGMSVAAPNLAAVISKRGGHETAGTSFGIQNSVNSLGQAAGPLIGGILFIWQADAPYVLSGIGLVAIAVILIAGLLFKRSSLFR